MNYQEVLDYLYSTLPMFHRVGPAAYNRSLDKTEELLTALGNPHQKIKTVHIAGTNGKGSVSSILAAVLTQAGYKTGLYTSPHLVDFRERIRINGNNIPRDFVTDWINNWKPLLEKIKPSFFETTVGLCFDYFEQEQIDIAIIETGLGGRIDSTNVIKPMVSVITNISWDHADLLGDTLEKIAGEKAGIIKENIPVISGTNLVEIIEVFKEFANTKNAKIIIAPEVWKVNHYSWENDFANLELENNSGKQLNIRTDLLGEYQQENIPTALCAIDEIRKNNFEISESQLLKAFTQVKQLSGLRGRMERIGEKPAIFTDTAHNEAGVKLVIHQIGAMTYSKLHIVWGMVGDKDRSKIFPLLPKEAEYYFVQPDLPRAFPAEALAKEAHAFNLRGNNYRSVWEGYAAALQQAVPEDLIYVGGSTFVVGELLGKL